MIEKSHYYPFGMRFYPESSANINAIAFRYNGKEYDSMNGLNKYDYGARFYDPSLGRWHSLDPKTEQMRRWSPYSFCYGNPLRFLDMDGMKPGDLFKTSQAAARDFGLSFNAISITSNREYGSTIYVVQKNGKTYYTYTNPNIGSTKDVNPSLEPSGTKKVADVHSHAAYDKKIDTQNGNGNDVFSSYDKWMNYDKNIDGYLVTPEGNLKKYDVRTTNETTLYSDMPSDPDDPKRVNNNNPTNLLPGMKTKSDENKQDWRQLINYWFSQNPFIQITVN
jgi:RHS repeat-associated protein